MADVIKRGSILLLLVIATQQCAQRSQQPGDRRGLQGQATQSPRPSVSSCDQASWVWIFQTADTKRERIAETFIFRRISGRIIPENTGGVWPGEVRPLFECRGVIENAPTYRVFADKDGKFVLENVPEGRYCFHIACLGWNSYIGTIIVDAEADPGGILSVEMAREWPMDTGGPKGAMRRADMSQSPFDICDTEDLSAADYIWDEIDKPFIVRKVEGRILGEGRGLAPDDCEWFTDMVPLVELRAIGKGTKVYRVFTDFRGRFSMSDISDGRYCLNANMFGWNACLCTIIVDRKADPKNEITVELNLAM